jgi:hypothetical protein
MGIKQDHDKASQSVSGTTDDIMSPIMRVPTNKWDGVRCLATGTVLIVSSVAMRKTTTSSCVFEKDSGSTKVNVLSFSTRISRIASMSSPWVYFFYSFNYT